VDISNLAYLIFASSVVARIGLLFDLWCSVSRLRFACNGFKLLLNLLDVCFVFSLDLMLDITWRIVGMNKLVSFKILMSLNISFITQTQ
jgi:hypothetical protein